MSSDVWGRPGRFVKFTGDLAQALWHGRFTALERGIIDFVLVQVMAVPDDTACQGVDTSVRRLAAALGAKVSGVERALRRLVQRGVVLARRHERGHGRRRYHLAHPSLWSGEPLDVGARVSEEWAVATVWPGPSVGLEAGAGVGLKAGAADGLTTDAGAGPQAVVGVGSQAAVGVGSQAVAGALHPADAGVGSQAVAGAPHPADAGVGLDAGAESAPRQTATRAREPEKESVQDGRESSFLQKGRPKERRSVHDLWMKQGGRRVSLVQAARQVAARLELEGLPSDAVSVRDRVERLYGQWWTTELIGEALDASRIPSRSAAPSGAATDTEPCVLDHLESIEPVSLMASWIAQAMASMSDEERATVGPVANMTPEPLPKGLGARVSPSGFGPPLPRVAEQASEPPSGEVQEPALPSPKVSDRLAERFQTTWATPHETRSQARWRATRNATENPAARTKVTRAGGSDT